MGTAHGAEELGLWPHGHACLAGAWGRYIGLCLGYGHIWKIQTSKGQQKYSAKPITSGIHIDYSRNPFHNFGP